MAIRTEAYGDNLIRTYSDQGVKIRQNGTGIIYCEAIDPAGSGRTYTETDEPVEEMTAEQLLEVLTGGEVQ